MIKVNNIVSYNHARAIYSARNAMNSWHLSDSNLDENIIGEKDLELAKKLVKAGSTHRKFLRQIMVSMDITAPLYWWSEFDTYKVGTTANSCSKMHKIHDKEFTIDDFSHEHLDCETFPLWVSRDNTTYFCAAYDFCNITCDVLNFYRQKFLETKDKKYWWQMIQLLPSSYNQTRTVTMSYENVFSMINQRKGHKLDEWVSFCETLKQLPYVKEIRG